MKRLVCAGVFALASMGLSAVAIAGPSAEEQTSAEQVKMCNDGLQQCSSGDQGACAIAIKTCVGESRGKAMELMAGG